MGNIFISYIDIIKVSKSGSLFMYHLRIEAFVFLGYTDKKGLNVLYQTKKRRKTESERRSFQKQRLDETLKERSDTSTVRVINPITRNHKAYAKIGKLFGLETVLFKSSDVEINNIRGFTIVVKI